MSTFRSITNRNLFLSLATSDTGLYFLNMMFDNDLDPESGWKASLLPFITHLLLALGFLGLFIGIHSGAGSLLLGGAATLLVHGVALLLAARIRLRRSAK